MVGSIRNSWSLALSDPLAFRQEQARLAHAWTLSGMTNQLAADKDWISAQIGSKAIFVQRFGDRLAGFENRCPHRFFPLRTAERGNGAIVCGYHHWRFAEDGLAFGIPHCPEVYGALPREVNASLKKIDIATCGSLIFGRVPAERSAPDLQEFLGEAFPILAAICSPTGRAHSFSDEINSNWRLPVEITLDDYHLVAIHHRKKYSLNHEMTYFRFNDHSAQFVHTEESLSDMARACKEGTYKPTGYRIFNIFPNLVVSLFPASPYWYCNVQQFVPRAVDRCWQRGWFFNTGIEVELSAYSRLIKPISEAIRSRIVRYYIEKIGNEDHRACEKLQMVAHQADASPLLSAQEQRVQWFEESYARWTGL